MKRTAALALAAFALAGCSTTPTVATDQSPPSASGTPSIIDRTAEVKATAGSTFQRLITKATEDEPGRLQVNTTLNKGMGTEATAVASGHVRS